CFTFCRFLCARSATSFDFQLAAAASGFEIAASLNRWNLTPSQSHSFRYIKPMPLLLEPKIRKGTSSRQFVTPLCFPVHPNHVFLLLLQCCPLPNSWLRLYLVGDKWFLPLYPLHNPFLLSVSCKRWKTLKVSSLLVTMEPAAEHGGSNEDSDDTVSSSSYSSSIHGEEQQKLTVVVVVVMYQQEKGSELVEPPMFRMGDGRSSAAAEEGTWNGHDSLVGEK
ncbi:unnamed protein product, partial [Linum tenue]